MSQRARAPDAPDSTLGRVGASLRALADSQRVVAGALVAAVVLVPLVFVPGARDIWVLPKLVVLAVAVIVATLASIASGARDRASAPARPGRDVELAVVAFAGLIALATVTSTDPGLSLEGERRQHQGLATILLYAALFFLARAAFSDHAAQRILGRVVLLTGVAVAAYAVVQAAGADPVWASLPKGRAVATIGQANALAAYLVLAFCLGLGALPERVAGRVAAVGGLALIGVGIALTLSRGGYLGIATALAVATWAGVQGRTLGRNWRMALPNAWLVLAGIVVAAMLLAAGPLRDEPARIIARVGQVADASENSARHHLALWSIGARIALDHPVLGTGPDTYAEVFPAYRDRALPPDIASQLARFRPESPHNVPIAIAAGAGLPALVAYLAIVVLVVRRLLSVRDVASGSRRPAIAVALLAAIAGHAMTDMFMTAEVTGSALFWIALGVGSTLGDTREDLRPQSA